jgi:hypothetical protein
MRLPVCFVRPAVSVVAVCVQHIKRLLIRQCCHLVRLYCTILSMLNRISTDIWSVLYRKTREHSQNRHHGKEVPHEQQRFSDCGDPETFPWTVPFRCSDFNYLWQKKSKNHHTLTATISKPCFYSLMNYGCHRHKRIDVTWLTILGLWVQNRPWVLFDGTTAPMGQGLLTVEGSRSRSVRQTHHTR